MKELSNEEIEQTKEASIKEGSAFSITSGLTEQYIVPFALALGASTPFVALLSSVPTLISSFFQIFGAYLTDLFENRKKIVIYTAFLQGAMLVPLFFLPFFTKNTTLLLVMYTLYLCVANVIAPAWNSWIGDVVPYSDRPSYFGKRNKLTTFFLIGSVLAAGLILHFLEHRIFLAFGILFIGGAVSRWISVYYFTRHYEPEYKEDIWHEESFVGFIEQLRENHFGRFVLYRSIFAFAVMVSAPFFTIYMLDILGFNYIEFSILLLAPMFIKAITMLYWGEFSSRFGNKKIMRVTSMCISTIPVLWASFAWIFGGTPLVFWFILIVEMFSGFVWGGFELTTFNYILAACPSKKRARLFAYYSIILGACVFLGSLGGIFLLSIVESANILLAIFFISGFLRLVCNIVFFPRVKDIDTHEKIEEKRLFYEVLINKPLGYAATLPFAQLIFTDDKKKE